jgi:hypothetical protein
MATTMATATRTTTRMTTRTTTTRRAAKNERRVACVRRAANDDAANDGAAPSPFVAPSEAPALTKRGKPMPKPQKPQRRKAKTGGKQGEQMKAKPPSAEEVAASERFDAIVAKGGAIFEVFVRAAGPNQWFPVGPLASESPRNIKKEIWAAEKPLKEAAFKMYPALAKPPAFGRVEYGYRERDESSKITEAQIREKQGQKNPFDDVILLTKDDDSTTAGAEENDLLSKFKKMLNPYDN